MLEGEREECLSMMEKMRPVMHRELARFTRQRYLYNIVETMLLQVHKKELPS